MYNATHRKVLAPIVQLRWFGIIQLVVSWFESVAVCKLAIPCVGSVHIFSVIS